MCTKTKVTGHEHWIKDPQCPHTNMQFTHQPSAARPISRKSAPSNLARPPPLPPAVKKQKGNPHARPAPDTTDSGLAPLLMSTRDPS